MKKILMDNVAWAWMMLGGGFALEVFAGRPDQDAISTWLSIVGFAWVVPVVWHEWRAEVKARENRQG